MVDLKYEPKLIVVVGSNDFGGKGVWSKNFSYCSLAKWVACVTPGAEDGEEWL